VVRFDHEQEAALIDDDRNELERFKQAIASDELIVGTGTMGGEALNDIAAQGKRRFLGLLPPSRHVSRRGGRFQKTPC